MYMHASTTMNIYNLRQVIFIEYFIVIAVLMAKVRFVCFQLVADGIRILIFEFSILLLKWISYRKHIYSRYDI